MNRRETAIAVAIAVVLCAAACSSAGETVAPTIASTVATDVSPAPAPTAGRCSPGESVPADVRSEFCALYDAMAATAARIAARPPTDAAKAAWCAQLTPANNHRGTALLEQSSIDGSLLYARRLKALGAACVTIAVSYPLLLQNASGGDGFPDANRYLDQYTRLIAGLRELGLRINIESGLMFPHPAFTTLPIEQTYQALRAAPDPVAVLRAGRVNVMTRILRQLRPDYLSIGSEPDVAASLLADRRIAALYLDPQAYAQDVEQTLVALKPARNGGVLIGAGVGTWQAYAKEYVSALNQTQLDYIDLHLYPVTDGAFDAFVSLADVAAAGGKRVAVSEAWLFKASRTQVGAEQWDATLSRNAVAYWQPLDELFLQTLGAAVRSTNVLFVSPFDSLSFFAYAPPTAVDARQATIDRAPRAADAVVKGTTTPTGEAFRRLANA